MAGMHGRHHRTAARPEDPARLAKERRRRPQVLQHQSAHHQVERRIRERQRLVQVVHEEAYGRCVRLAPRLRQHALREVDGGDARAGRGEPLGVAAGAAAEVQHRAPPDVAQRLAHDGLLERRQRVRVVIVDDGPAVVARADRRGGRSGFHGCAHDRDAPAASQGVVLE
jgi:hypothetical protein